MQRKVVRQNFIDLGEGSSQVVGGWWFDFC
jgi:hypothetical protein